MALTEQDYQDIGRLIDANTPVDQKVRQQYPQMAWAFDNPELGPLLRQAVTEKWDPARLQGALQNTNWWKTTDEAQRTWQRLTAEDPASAYQEYLKAANTVQTTAARLGVTLTGDALKSIGTSLATEAWDAGRVTQEILKQATGYDPNGKGDINGMVDQVKSQATNFLMPMSDDAAFGWAKNVLGGTSSQDGLTAYLRQQSVNRFSGDQTIVDALKNGATTKDIFDPYVQQTAQLLEMSPASINLMDPKWMTMIDGNRDDGTRRPMSLSEAAQHVRGLDEWKTTQQAGQEQSALGEELLKTFGKVA